MSYAVTVLEYVLPRIGNLATELRDVAAAMVRDAGLALDVAVVSLSITARRRRPDPLGRTA